MKKNKAFPIIITVVVVGALATLIFFPAIHSGANQKFDGFSQCLAEKDATMYGAEWCSHCQSQKKLFGNSFSYVPYVECPENTSLCIEKGIEGYPTWILSDGTKLIGEQDLDVLAEKTGCELPQ